MGKFSGKTSRLVIMLLLRVTAVLLEIAVFYMTNSVEIFGNALHMVADCIAIAVGLASIQVSRRVLTLKLPFRLKLIRTIF